MHFLPLTNEDIALTRVSKIMIGREDRWTALQATLNRIAVFPSPYYRHGNGGTSCRRHSPPQATCALIIANFPTCRKKFPLSLPTAKHTRQPARAI